MSAEEPDFPSHHINPGLTPKHLDNPSTIDYAASMGRSQVIGSAAEEVGKSMNVEHKNMKKKIFLLPQEVLDYILSNIRPKQVSRRLIERDPHAAAKKEKLRERILAEQERMRREYEAKGYATYVVEVPDHGARYEGELGDVDNEEEDAATVVKQAEATVDAKKELGDMDDEEENVAAVIKHDEVTIDEKKEEDASLVKQAEVTVDTAVAEADVIDGAAPLNFPHRRGRRRFRPGVVKQTGGGVKKIVM